MKGTIFSATFEIDWIPPKMIMLTKTAKTKLIIFGDQPTVLLRESVIELTCVNVPEPNSATITPKIEKAIARGFQRFPIPLTI